MVLLELGNFEYNFVDFYDHYERFRVKYDITMKKSAGILLFRKAGSSIQVLLVHPGGPFWKNKDVGAWSIPKGEYEEGEEDAQVAAVREFFEETGHKVSGELIELKPVRQKSGKWIRAWAVEGDMDATRIQSNTFSLEWPPRSGKRIDVPEVDKAGWFSVEEARTTINPAQAALLDDLLATLA